MAMMLCLTLYTPADGFFIARYVGVLALAALNMFNPMWGLLLALGIMPASGGSAMVGQLPGASKAQPPLYRAYLGTLLLFSPAIMLQLLVQTFFVTAGWPMLGFLVTMLAGVTNAAADYVFMGPCGFGLAGVVALVLVYYFEFVATSVFFGYAQGVSPRHQL